MRERIILVGLLSVVLLVAGCGGSSAGGGDSAQGGGSAKSCDLKDPPLFEEGRLTVATDKPAYPSWFEGDPQDYSGYEGDVASELAREGMTMLIATHEMGFARDIADRVCFLDEGRILEQGRPEKIFTAPEHPRTRRFLARIIEAGRL